MAGLSMHAVAGSGEPAVQAASSLDHIWLLIDGDPVTLTHVGRGDDRVLQLVDRPLSRWPLAVAAWGDALWIVMPPDERQRRATYRLEAAYSPSLRQYGFAPRDRLQIVPPLEGPGRLVGLAGTPRGPVALLEGEGPDAAATRLVQLSEGRWVEMEGPAGLPDEATLRLVGPGPGGRDLMILAAARRDRTSTTVHRRDAEDAWRTIQVELDLRSVTEAVRVGSRLLLVRRVGTPQRQTAYELSYLVTDRLVGLTRMPAPGGSWLVAATGGGLYLLELVGPAGATITSSAIRSRRIDPVSGVIGEPAPMRDPPGAAAVVIHQSLLLALLITVTMLVLVARPGQQPAPTLSDEHAPLPMLPRLASLLVDLLPGALVAVAVLHADPIDLIRTPLLSTHLADSAPFLLMVGVTTFHTTVTELALGRTLGKLLVGARVLSIDGGHAGLLAIAGRNLVKLVLLLIPPLVLLTLLNPHLQGVHDLFARTIVVGRRVASEGST